VGGGISKKYNSALGYQHWNWTIIKEVSSSSAQMKTEFFLTLLFCQVLLLQQILEFDDNKGSKFQQCTDEDGVFSNLAVLSSATTSTNPAPYCSLPPCPDH
jgi:hypothetical protein